MFSSKPVVLSDLLKCSEWCKLYHTIQNLVGEYADLLVSKLVALHGGVGRRPHDLHLSVGGST